MRYSLRLSAMICCLILFQSDPSPANDAPLILESGGAQVLSGPLTVRMESEVVRITLGEQSYVVDATFNFQNTGQKIEFDVGFPKNGEGWIDDRFSHTADFIKFETWVNGQPVNFIEQPNMARIEGGYTLPDLIKSIKKTEDVSQLRLTAIDKRWMVKERVQFPSNKTTTTRVRYEAPYNPASPCKGTLGYIYGTGNYWNGNIGKSTFIIDSTRIPKGDRPKHIYISDELDRQKAKLTTPRVGIIQCVIQDYKPHTSNAWIGLTVGCPWND